MVGDLHTTALIGLDGRVDFACMPRFDSAAVFCQLLDDERGGVFRISPVEEFHSRQMYLSDSNVVMTRFFAGGAIGELIDGMVPRVDGAPAARGHPLVRKVRVVRGRQTFALECRPSFDWGREAHTVELVDRVGAVFRSAAGSLTLRTRAPLPVDFPQALTHLALISAAVNLDRALP